MDYWNKVLNLALGGGGVKGIAYLGVFESAYQRGYRWENIAGVSAGALAGAFAAAGYSPDELRSKLDSFDTSKIANDKIHKRIPVVSRYIEYYNGIYPYGRTWAEDFLTYRHYGPDRGHGVHIDAAPDIVESRGNLIENIINFSLDGYFCDGDYIEEWVFKILKERGIETFADVKNGKADSTNPCGYKIRMTAVDLNRWKVITLPDDLSYYGIDPDSFQVSRAIRMSTSVPFAFKPVEIKKVENGIDRTYHIVDGGVLDNFPIWLVDKSTDAKTVGFKLDGGKNKIFSLDMPLSILRVLISIVHNIGVPEYEYDYGCVASINVSKVSTLHFDLSEDEKQYLFDSGKRTADMFFSKYEHKNMSVKRYRHFYVP